MLRKKIGSSHTYKLVEKVEIEVKRMNRKK